MKGLAFSSLRTGKRYQLTNFGERYTFQLEKILPRDFQLKDLGTLETYHLSELIQFGKGPDFEILEL